MVDITNLEAQVQNRIDNLSGTETLEQLLELKRASEFISVDTTDLDTAIETRIASFDVNTDRLDLLIGNRLALNPYTQGGGGGNWKTKFFSGQQNLGASTIGDFIELNSTTLSLADNEYVRLTGLLASGSVTHKIDVSVLVDGVTIVGPARLQGRAGTSFADSFCIGPSANSSADATFEQFATSVIDYLEGRDIKVNVGSASSSGLRYSYEIGVYE